MDACPMGGTGGGDTAGGKWQATLRRRVASLTSTACRGSFDHHGDAAGEGA
ncbi:MULTISPECIES: DUF6380 family protein [unclassified Streptomyces]|uniref:DUF6380 family protein n=1 Tax=unclassified Streptomyces TaxID=2593676 RepID=UPI0033B7FAF6